VATTQRVESGVAPGGLALRLSLWSTEAGRIWRRLRRSPLSLIGLVMVTGLILVAVLAPQVAPYPQDVDKVHFDRTFQRPSLDYPFGTDEVGRDILSRVILGSRISLTLGFIVLAIAIGVGVPLGLIAGYYGGWIQTVIMRITDIFLSFPPLVLALAVSAVLAPTLQNTIVAISFGWWPWYTRLVEGMTLSAKEEGFVEASRSLGARPLYICFREILPNLSSIVLIKATLDIGYAILVGAALGFLGLGVQPPTPEWGTMAAEGRFHLPDRWWLTTFPGLAIFVTVLAFNLLGDGLRDAFDVELN
jgi:peptide/nickel transport system permease protein